MADETPSRLDLFLEKTLTEMDLDEDQAAKVGHALRTHLEAAIANAIAGGLTPGQAETEALLAFSQPTLLARPFGALQGAGWLVFERLAFAVPYFLMVLLAVVCAFDMARQGLIHSSLQLPLLDQFLQASWLAYPVAFCFALWDIALNLWQEVRVSGDVHIRRFLRPTLTLPFDAIQDVSLIKGHLFGARQILITHDGGSVIITSKLRNTRCLALALLALAPAALRPEVSDYFQRLTRSIRPEGPWFRRLLTLSWLVALGCLALAFPATWAIRGFSPWLIAAWPLAALTAWVQAMRHTDRAKRGACWLALAGLIFSSGTFVNLTIGNTSYVRGFLILQLAMTAFPLFALWWRGRRSGLPAAFVLLAGALAGGWFMIPPVTTVPSGALAYFPGRLMTLESATWLNNPKPTYYTLQADIQRLGEMRLQTDYTLLWAAYQKTGSLPLAPGKWRLLPNYNDETLTLVWQDDTRDPAATGYVVDTRIYLYRPGDPDGAMQLLDFTRCHLYWPEFYSHFWSPDKDYYVLPQAPLTSGTAKSDLKIVDMKTRQSRRVPATSASHGWWSDRETLKIFNMPIPDGYVPPATLLTFEIWSIDARTGKKTLEQSNRIEKSFEPHLSRHSIFFVAQPYRMRRYDLASGALEEFTGDYDRFSSRPQSDRYFYFLQQNQRRHLIVADAGKTLLDRALQPGEIIQDASLSPDGGKLFYTLRNGRGVLGDGLLSYRVYDLAARNEDIIQRFSFFQEMAAVGTPLFEGFAMPLLHWTPSGRTLAYPQGTWRNENGKVTPATALCVATFK